MHGKETGSRDIGCMGAGGAGIGKGSGSRGIGCMEAGGHRKGDREQRHRVHGGRRA